MTKKLWKIKAKIVGEATAVVEASTLEEAELKAEVHANWDNDPINYEIQRIEQYAPRRKQ